MTLPGRQKNEICALCRLHPELRDLYVEGYEDMRFWRWLVKSQRLTHVAIYPGGSIEPSSIDEKSNNKARVISLASFAEEVLGPTQMQITCVVDLDFDHLEDSVRSLTCLFYTEATSLETEFCKPQYLDKFLGLVCRLDISLSSFMSEMTRILRDIAALRLANQRLNMGLGRVAFEKNLDLTRDLHIEFDRESFADRYMQGTSREQRTLLLKVADEIGANLPTECHKVSRGHDFVAFLGWFALKAVREVRQNDEVARWLLSMAEPEIALEAPFSLVLARLTS
jgi:hypothetical protein